MKGSDFIGLGYNFLQLTINSIEEMEKQGNKSLLFFPASISYDEIKTQYDEKTKWTDNNIAIPVLFNFYHGVELVLKGLILRCGGEIVKTHNLTNITLKLKSSPNPPNIRLLNFFDNILQFDLNKFFNTNKRTVDSFYESFRYPQFNNGDDVVFKDIRGLDSSGLELFLNIKDLAVQVKIEIMEWLAVENKRNIK